MNESSAPSSSSPSSSTAAASTTSSCYQSNHKNQRKKFRKAFAKLQGMVSAYGSSIAAGVDRCVRSTSFAGLHYRKHPLLLLKENPGLATDFANTLHTDKEQTILSCFLLSYIHQESTLIQFHQHLLSDPKFISGKTPPLVHIAENGELLEFLVQNASCDEWSYPQDTPLRTLLLEILANPNKTEQEKIDILKIFLDIIPEISWWTQIRQQTPTITTILVDSKVIESGNGHGRRRRDDERLCFLPTILAGDWGAGVRDYFFRHGPARLLLFSLLPHNNNNNNNYYELYLDTKSKIPMKESQAIAISMSLLGKLKRLTLNLQEWDLQGTLSILDSISTNQTITDLSLFVKPSTFLTSPTTTTTTTTIDVDDDMSSSSITESIHNTAFQDALQNNTTITSLTLVKFGDYNSDDNNDQFLDLVVAQALTMNTSIQELKLRDFALCYPQKFINNYLLSSSGDENICRLSSIQLEDVIGTTTTTTRMDTSSCSSTPPDETFVPAKQEISSSSSSSWTFQSGGKCCRLHSIYISGELDYTFFTNLISTLLGNDNRIPNLRNLTLIHEPLYNPEEDDSFYIRGAADISIPLLNSSLTSKRDGRKGGGGRLEKLTLDNVIVDVDVLEEILKHNNLLEELNIRTLNITRATDEEEDEEEEEEEEGEDGADGVDDVVAVNDDDDDSSSVDSSVDYAAIERRRRRQNHRLARILLPTQACVARILEHHNKRLTQVHTVSRSYFSFVSSNTNLLHKELMKIDYYTSLNQYGRREIASSENVTKKKLVGLLCDVHQQRTTTQEDLGGGDAAEPKHVLQYGLLRIAPHVWSE